MNHPKNTEGAPLLGAPYESVTVFLTLYIQNSKLKKGNRKILEIYFCRVPKYLQSFVIENPLDKIFSNRHFRPSARFCHSEARHYRARNLLSLALPPRFRNKTTPTRL